MQSNNAHTLLNSFKRQNNFFKIERSINPASKSINCIEFHTFPSVGVNLKKNWDNLFENFLKDNIFVSKTNIVLSKKGYEYVQFWKNNFLKDVSKFYGIRTYTGRGKLIGVAFFNEYNVFHNMSVKAQSVIQKIKQKKKIIFMGYMTTMVGILSEFIQYNCKTILSDPQVSHIVFEIKVFAPLDKLLKKFGFTAHDTIKDHKLYIIEKGKFSTKLNFVKILVGEKWRKNNEGGTVENKENLVKGKIKKRVSWYTKTEIY